MNSKIPNRTQLIVKSDKLRKSIKSFKSSCLIELSDLDKTIITDKLKADGCSITTNLLGYTKFEENQFEFALSFVWNIEFTEKLDISSIEIIDKWANLEEETKSILINSVKELTHSFKYLESLFYLNNINTPIVFILITLVPHHKQCYSYVSFTNISLLCLTRLSSKSAHCSTFKTHMRLYYYVMQ